MILHGKCVSSGLAQGTAHVLDVGDWLATALAVRAALNADGEAERVRAAIAAACRQLGGLQQRLNEGNRLADAEIFAAHQTMLTDTRFADRILVRVYDDGLSAEAAVAREVVELRSQFSNSELPVIQDKVGDILDIGRRLMLCMTTTAEGEGLRGDIVVAASITPSELVRFAHQGVAGVITEHCGAKAHTAILARGLGVPMVTGIRAPLHLIHEGARIVLDATEGTVVIEAAESEREAEQLILEKLARSLSEKAENLPAVTLDGIPISLLLNISDPLEAEAVPRLGAAGIGLFRTEFLYMDRVWWPSEDESYAPYARVAASIGETELNIRLADFGADKSPPYADIPLPRNPSLGIRGVRLLLERDDILNPQVQAIARLARERPLTLLLPMIDTLDTLHAILERLCKICGCAGRDELPFRIGSMIEVPAAALTIDEIIPHVDAVSVGLNDLTQYLLAADRDDEAVEPYHDALQPAVLRLVRRVVEAADRHGKPVTMCGELAGDANLATVLLALGVRRFSVSRFQFQNVVTAVRRASLAEAPALRSDLLQLNSGRAVREFLLARQPAPTAGP